jgi:hypothetical protein
MLDHIRQLEKIVEEQKVMISKVIELVHEDDEFSMGYDILCTLGEEC